MKRSKLRYDLQSIRPIEKNVFGAHTLGKVVRADEDESEAKPTAIQGLVMASELENLSLRHFKTR